MFSLQMGERWCNKIAILMMKDSRLKKISKQGDYFRKLDEYIDWEMFLLIIKKSFRKEAKRHREKRPVKIKDFIKAKMSF